jgi:DnaJ-class molecular chaperone
MGKNYYEKFQIPEKATKDEIKRAYRKLALKYHPDKNSGDIKFENIFKQINSIYEVLSSEELRRKYDIELTKRRAATNKFNTDKQSNEQQDKSPHKSSANNSFYERAGTSNTKAKTRDSSKDIYVFLVVLFAIFIVLRIFSNGKTKSNFTNTNSAEESNPKTGEISFGKPNEASKVNDTNKFEPNIKKQNTFQPKRPIEHLEKTGEIKF